MGSSNRLRVLAATLALASVAAAIAAGPLGPEERRSTSSAIFLTNLDSRIDATQRVLDRRRSAGLLLALAQEHYLRGRILGRLSDFERAHELTAEALAAAPDDRAVRAFRARTLAHFHAFEEARALLAETAPYPERETDLAAIDLALGRYDQLPPLPPSPTGNIVAYAAHAARLADGGRTAEAHEVYDAAQHVYRDVSPYPLAWLHTQQGILHLRSDELEAAERYFAAAHARLPEYYLAAEHLAEVIFARGDAARARELYRQVVEQTGDPAFRYQLSRVERALGDEAEADRQLATAEQDYDKLLATHEAAFADHGARFYSDIGRHERALALALANLAGRKGVDAWLLLAEVALAAGARDETCAALAGARATGQKPPELAALEAQLDACSEKDDGSPVAPASDEVPGPAS